MLDKCNKSPSVPTDQEKKLPDATESSGNGESNVNLQMMELYSELLKAMKENVTVEETGTLEGKTLAIIRDSRGQLFLVLKNKEGNFEKFAGNHASDIPEENVYDTFKWLKGKKIKDFIDLSTYRETAAENKGKTS